MDESAQEEFDEHRLRFYALIGYCITRYQSVEDYLPTVFAAALGGSEKRAAAVFELMRGLEAKLDAVTAALADAPQVHQDRWKLLLKRVAKGAAARNQIAHASPVHNGPPITVIISEDPATPHRAFSTGKSQMELVKKTKKGNSVWTEASMREEANRMSSLFGHMIGFVKELNGEEVPDHLKEKP